MRRHDRLIPLTHDHHHALARARAMRVAAEQADPEVLVNEARRFLDFFDSETVEHFRDEEESLFPRFVEASRGVPELLLETLKQHVEIHAQEPPSRRGRRGARLGRDRARNRRKARGARQARGKGPLPPDRADDA